MVAITDDELKAINVIYTIWVARVYIGHNLQLNFAAIPDGVNTFVSIFYNMARIVYRGKVNTSNRIFAI